MKLCFYNLRGVNLCLEWKQKLAGRKAAEGIYSAVQMALDYNPRYYQHKAFLCILKVNGEVYSDLLDIWTTIS